MDIEALGSAGFEAGGEKWVLHRVSKVFFAPLEDDNGEA